MVDATPRSDELVDLLQQLQALEALPWEEQMEAWEKLPIEAWFICVDYGDDLIRP